MNMVKALLVSSAAALTGFAAQAADLPKKSAPAEYVKVCNGFGAGFYMIPGSTTCIQLGGFVRSEIFMGTSNGSMTTIPAGGGTAAAYAAGTYTQAQGQNSYAMGSRFFLHADARTQTSMGIVRSYGRYLGTTGSSSLYGASGIPAAAVSILESFIQFAGITTGYALSNYGFYQNDYSFGGGHTLSGFGDVRNNQLAYTAALGNGINATIALEDGAGRRLGNAPASTNIVTPLLGAAYLAANVDSAIAHGANKMPDVVANINVTQAWGSAQVMAAYHDVRSSNGASTAGYAIGGGVKVNAGPVGSQFAMQAGYTNGATAYVVGQNRFMMLGNSPTNAAGHAGLVNDAYVNAGLGITTTKAWSVMAGYNAVWSPSFRSYIVGSYQNVDQPTHSGVITNPAVLDSKGMSLAIGGSYTAAPGLTLGLELFYDKVEYTANGTPAPIALGGLGAPTAAYTIPSANTSSVGVAFRVQRAF